MQRYSLTDYFGMHNKTLAINFVGVLLCVMPCHQNAYEQKTCMSIAIMLMKKIVKNTSKTCV
jgi:hypothetical protein